MTTDILTTDEWNKKRARSGQGRLAQATGRGFENDLEWTHGRFRIAGRADVFKLPVETAPIPRAWLRDPTAHGGMCRILSARQRADYFGAVGPAEPDLLGRALVMEAKYSSERAASIPILREDQKGSGLKAHQLEALVNAAAFGTLAAVVWRNGHERLIFLPDVLAWAWAEFRLGKIKRLAAVDGVPYMREGDGGNVIDDWLTPLLAFGRGARRPA